MKKAFITLAFLIIGLLVFPVKEGLLIKIE